jgi:hypothetical protein
MAQRRIAMAVNAEMHMAGMVYNTSRSARLGTIALAPIASSPSTNLVSHYDAMAALLPALPDQPVELRRSQKGRSNSRFRYHNAESFFLGVEKGIVRDPHDRLYQVGIVLQLGLSSHLLDVGFTDQWCVRHIGLDVTRSLACANATGFGFESSDFDQLAAILSPYGKWRLPQSLESSTEIPFTAVQLLKLTRTLLDHVRQVTGHSRPRGKRA